MWRSPSGRYYDVPSRAMKRPTLPAIANIWWAPEVVRELIDRYGNGRFRGAKGFVRDIVRSGGHHPWIAMRLDHEEGVGTLWAVRLHSENPLHVVEVIDSAAMKGGRHKHHWLRVPHTIMTARAAVAWTFRLRADQYRPAKET